MQEDVAVRLSDVMRALEHIGQWLQAINMELEAHLKNGGQDTELLGGPFAAEGSAGLRSLPEPIIGRRTCP